MKILFLLPIFIFLGCATTSINTDRTTLDNCDAVQPYWYGEKGESPVNNSVWKCFDWEIQAIER